MKYSIHNVEDKETGDFYHAVFEEDTQQVIQFHYFLDDAKTQAKFMENGGAFRGFTPSYMLKETYIRKRKKEIDNEFNKLLK